jgi:hypothetical protein
MKCPISFFKQRLGELLRVEGLQIVRLFAGLHLTCLNFSNSLSSGNQ